MAGFTDYQRTHRLLIRLIRSATRRKDKLRAAFFFSDDLPDKGGRLKTYFPAFNAANRSAIRLLRLKSSNSFNFANCAASVLLCTAF